MLRNNFSALVADPSSTVRLSLRAILQSFDVTRIDTASTVSEARRRLLDGRYDLVLCEYHFESDETGHDLLEEMREKHQLPPSTIFIMVTSEASYARVIGVAEETPDDYMLKPINAGELADRIEKCFRRRESLMDIYECLGRSDYNGALKHAQRIMSYKTPYLGDVVRVSANTMYKLGRYNEALNMYKKLLQTRNPAWAKLGMAKIAIKQGDKETAEAAMRDLVAQHLHYLPVYNQLTDLYLSEDRFADALDITEQAIKITPLNLKRLQQAGQLSYSLGDKAKAVDFLTRAVKINGKAVDLSYRTIFHLILLHFGSGQMADGASLTKQIRAKCDADPTEAEHKRGEWYCELSLATESIAKREPLAAIDIMRRLSGFWDSPEFNFDLALDYLSVLDRLYADDIANVLVEWIRSFTLRFATGRHAHDLMVQAISAHEKLVLHINDASEHISKIANDAAQLMLENNVRAAADILVAEGTKTLNNRLLAAAANAAARCFQLEQDEMYSQHTESCLALMTPPDENLTNRLRSMLVANPAT